ncbi:MAG: quinol dehydrogenase ferredoxin subunit NapH [Rubrivivax sp.]|nr:quinol dehydrogenase ferredoxin subunit NapH [Rubrivivax sp.]
MSPASSPVSAAVSAAVSASVRAPVRHLPAPTTLRAHLHAMRFTLARRMVQLGMLVCFYGTLHWGWKVFGQPLLTGDLSAAKLLGTLPLADPLAALQILAAGHPLVTEILIGVAVTLGVYAALGGRVFCGWVCPMNIVTDVAAWLRGKLGLADAPDLVTLPARTRYGVLVLALVVSAIAGVAAFEAFSPIAMLHRELIYGAGLGLSAALGILLLDTLVLRRGWCGHLCPLGAFWALAGRGGLVKVAFDDASCTRCGDCVRACPEPQVLHFNTVAARGMVASGECTSCGRCVAVCPEDSLKFDLRLRIHAAAPQRARGAPPVSGGSS